ncbi:MAG TPA: DUF305 domain-containing protein [Longimicrobiales bacterium]
MSVSRTHWTSAALFAVLAATACSGATRAGTGAGEAVRPEERPAAEIEALYRARKDSALTRFNEADVRFMTGMISHHAQALVMAGFAATHGASPAVQTLAARIINAQKDEIATMQRWLRDRGQPVPEVHIEGANVMVHGAGGGMDMSMQMPGMLTPEQMRQLEQAHGAEFDRLFLTFMIQHHRGAVTMVHDLFRTDGAGQGDLTFKLASDIQADQTTEIARMKLMLSALPAEGRAP